jgi:hypothetical protein
VDLGNLSIKDSGPKQTGVSGAGGTTSASLDGSFSGLDTFARQKQQQPLQASAAPRPSMTGA